MKSIRIKTEIPGPGSRALSEGAPSSLANPVLPSGKVFIANASGAVVEDVDGNRFIDFIGGVGCLVAGHSHPWILEAVHDQVNKFLHTDFSVVPYEVYLKLAERIANLCGGNRKVALFNSGAEAVENAVKVARGATGRPGVICFEGAFHGRTLMAMTLTSREVPYKKGFGPFAPEVYRAPYPNFDGASLDDSINAIKELIARHSIAAIIVEPVLGEGGFVVPPPEFLSRIAEISDRHEIVFIADEVQSGYGRTGAFLASEISSVRPGIVVLGKSIASGLPLSAVVGEPRFMDALTPHALGGTYPGNPVACAAASAVLDVIESENLIERAGSIGVKLMEFWGKMSESYTGISQIRGLGSMVGVEFGKSGMATDLVGKVLERGVLMMTAGREASVIRHLMPLVITDEQLDEAFEALRAALDEISQ